MDETMIRIPIDDAVRLAPAVSLEDVLASRDRRAERQRELLGEYPGDTLVSFTMNIPGEHKAYPLAGKAFRLGQDRIAREMKRRGFGVRHSEDFSAAAGFGMFFVVSGPAGPVKDAAVAIEESHPLGRLFDIDVLGPDGGQIRGESRGRGERRCLVCGGPVWECARSGAHPAEQLARRTAESIRNHFAAAFADDVAAMATRALLHEVAVTPKPGLVDRVNNGSHADMDIFTFIDSSVTLTPFFRRMALAGLEHEGPAASLLPRLRLPGLWAEDAMYAATGGVNTHRGLIFSLGLLCAAVGVAVARGAELRSGRLLDICGEIAAATPDELRRAGAAAPTHGEAAFARFGMTGVRGAAARGFPDVREHGYPALRRVLAKGGSLNDAGVAALLHLLAHVQDTNIVTRSDPATLRRVQEETAAALRRCGDDPDALAAFARKLDGDFIAAGISAGGCADLLALSYMAHFVESWSGGTVCDLS